MAGAVGLVVGDVVVSFLWTVCMYSLGAATAAIASAFALVDDLSTILITVALFMVLIAVFEGIAGALGGASYNPTSNAALYAAGLGKDSLLSMAIRFPAQIIGAVGGTLAIVEMMPQEYKHTLVAPSLKVDMNSGAMAEGLLTFAITFVVLWLQTKGPKNPLVQLSIATGTTIVLVLAGLNYTGPCLNPVNPTIDHLATTRPHLLKTRSGARGEGGWDAVTWPAITYVRSQTAGKIGKIAVRLAGHTSRTATIHGDTTTSTGLLLSLAQSLLPGLSSSSSPFPRPR
ncbi:aquaporin SIP1-1 [Iris pallida]|uniref:Aquaporin SIP1-1 n=1 Tax=Iris pallida TaxID=29817 RepID=A0AAX6ICT5_IRIPA|nr:aquaporin SIP1-1 [Iris pallida]